MDLEGFLFLALNLLLLAPELHHLLVLQVYLKLVPNRLYLVLENILGQKSLSHCGQDLKNQAKVRGQDIVIGIISQIDFVHGEQAKNQVKVPGQDILEMRESLTEFFTSKDRDWYRSGIHQLEEQLQKVIESDGEYF
uniref:Uncharacterized protein n=1 Tax=Acrobeloides nanus TaxID=290746 RepID=A0A914BW78_9BILA